MSNPPPWNDPIKPPNGNFSLEERKWREGITRGLNNIKIKSLGDIGDVDLTSPSANEILKFDGSNWVNGTPSVTVTNWGDIVGSLSNQTDLQNALNAKADLLSLALVATSGSYNDLSDKPTIPTVNDATLTIQKNSSNVGTFTANASSNVTVDISVPTDTNDLTNGAGYITANDIPALPSDTDLSHYDNTTSAFITSADIPSLPTDTDLSHYDNSTSDFVDSNDLSTKQDVIDNNNPLSASYVSGLATVATSGDYTDLLNKPTIPTVNDATLTIQKNGTNVATFTANASSNATANISVPTDTSDLTNTAGFITGVSSINDIGDVTITTPSSGELLKYDGSKWINGSPSTSVTNWGDILGTLSNQTDLQNALNDKQDVIDANNKLSSTYLTFNSDIIPTTNNTYDIGSSSLRWKKAYLSSISMSQNGVAFEVESQHSLKIEWRDDPNASTRMIYCENSDFRPFGDNVINCGNASNRWNNVYSNAITLTSNCKIQHTAGGVAMEFYWYDHDDSTSATIQLVGNCMRAIPDNKIRLGNEYFHWKEIFCTNPTINTSDMRLKSNIEPLTNALDKLNSINIMSYTMEGYDKYISYGFIAQDEMEKNPELVYVPSEYDETKEDSPKLGVVTGNVIYLAVKAIQELSEKVTKLEQQLGELV